MDIGKQGTLTPVANLEPVRLAGTTVSRASLHNADFIKAKDIRVGDLVVIEKAGEIIPYVVRSEPGACTGAETVYRFPAKCPVCQSPVERDEGGAYELTRGVMATNAAIPDAQEGMSAFLEKRPPVWPE